MKTRVAINLLFLLSVIFLPADLRADWSSDWMQTVAAAKKEGRLNLYVGRYGQAALLDEFKKDYPDIRVVSVNGTGDQLATRIAAEARAGKTIADIYSGGPNSSYSSLYRGRILDSIKSAFILPEVLDESKWYGGKHIFTDSEDQFIFVYIALPGVRGLSYNSNLVNAKEFKSFWDLTNPKWKGKITSQRPTETGLSVNLQFYYYQPELGPEFIKRAFSAMEVTFGDRRTITDWLAVAISSPSWANSDMAPWAKPPCTPEMRMSHSTQSVGTMRRMRRVLSRLLPPAFWPSALPMPEGTWSAMTASIEASMAKRSRGRIQSRDRPSSSGLSLRSDP